MSTLKPSPPASPTTMAFYAWLERPPSPLPIPVPLTPRQFFPLPISPNFFNYTILAPNSTPSSPAKSELSSPPSSHNGSPSSIPVPLTPRQLFPLPISPISFNTILSPDSTPPSPSSPIITKKSTAARAVLSPIKEYSDQHQEPPEVDVLLRLYEAQNAPEHVLRNLRKI